MSLGLTAPAKQRGVTDHPRSDPTNPVNISDISRKSATVLGAAGGCRRGAAGVTPPGGGKVHRGGPTSVDARRKIRCHDRTRVSARRREGGFWMALCTICDNEMTNLVSCSPDSISLGGKQFELIRWGDERTDYPADCPCRDCGTPIGGVHHFGCCVERCPACFDQRAWCRCNREDDPYDDEEYDEDDEEFAPAASTTRAAAALRAASLQRATADHQRRSRARCTTHRAPWHYRT